MIEVVDFSDLGAGIVRHLPYSSTRLSLYERLIQYFAVVSTARGEYLDMINFHRETYPEVISLRESEMLFHPEHGYASPDGAPELGVLIRAYERLRAECFARQSGVHVALDFEALGTGIGAGTTGVMNCLLPAIRDSLNRTSPRVILSVPLYSVYDGMVREHGLTPTYLHTRRSCSFLPTIEDIRDALHERPIAVILTFPGNPAQTTYGPSRFAELIEIVRLCVESETYFIADNIYQDTIWSPEALNPEVLAPSHSPQFIVKVSGLSKDRPGCSGWRIGHWIGDPLLQDRYCYYSSIQYNTPNSASRCVLALDLLVRMARMRGSGIYRSDLDLLGNSLAGWSRPLDRDRLFDSLESSGFVNQWRSRLDQVEAAQRSALNTLVKMANDAGVFSDIVNDNIGNVLLLRVAPEIFGGTDHELFLRLMEKTGIGILPANAFGFHCVRGEAWFRITTIHEKVDRLAARFERVVQALRMGIG